MKLAASVLAASIALMGRSLGSEAAEHCITVPLVAPVQRAEPVRATTYAARGGTLVYLNREGGTFSSGPTNDSSLDRSTVLRRETTIAPWSIGTKTWTEILDCVGANYRNFDIRFIDEDPSPQPHVEVVIGGTPKDLGILNSDTAGVAPLAPDCTPIPMAIAHVFPSVVEQDPARVCETIAHEVGHTLGLEHSFHCPDVMSYLDGCGVKQFRNTSQQCGERGPRPCRCREAQNPQQVLGAVLPKRQLDRGAPSVRIVSPEDNARIPPSFSLWATAEDETGITRVELYVDGELSAIQTEAPYSFESIGLDPGPHQVKVIARDGARATESSIGVVVDPQASVSRVPVSGVACSGTDHRNGIWALVAALLYAVTKRRRFFQPSPDTGEMYSPFVKETQNG